MKNQTIKSLTEAHAWVGVIISTVLFVVFIAGSFSLFRDNISSWERAELAKQVGEFSGTISYDKAIESIAHQYDVDTDHGFFMLEPSAHNPFIEVYFATHLEAPDPISGEDHQDQHLLLSPTSGKILADANRFEFATFLYELHYDLGLGKFGLYFVGVITLFFFVAILSGICIHWRKLAKNFFQFRAHSSKDSKLDAHNLIGTMGLPMHLMYAFTGLVFNLVIIYQISYAVLLYGGDQTALLQAAGFNEPKVTAAQQKMAMTGVDALRTRALNTFENADINVVEITHFGDKNAIVSFTAKSNDTFSNLNEVQYSLLNQEQIYLTQDNYDNAVRAGLATIASLHFGDFAGYGMRIAFLVLALATAYVIVTGNLMWITKRSKQRHYSAAKVRFVKHLSAGAFTGVLLAIANGFLATALIESSYSEKLTLIKYCVFASFAFALISTQLVTKLFSYTKTLLGLSALSFISSIVVILVALVCQFSQLPWQTRLDHGIVIALLALFALICGQAIKQLNQAEHANHTQAASEYPLTSQTH